MWFAAYYNRKIAEKSAKKESGVQLKTEKSRFYRVKKGQTASLIEKTLNIPAGCAFAGAIIPLRDFSQYTVQPFDTYASIAASLGIEEERLKEANGNRPLYPSRKIFIPI